jgi:two-component system nitrogen regulation response regulator NtrX
MSYILVVDDEPDIRDLVKDILEDEGHQVGMAENGLAAKRLLRERRPELIFLDIWMPDLDGISLLKEWAEGDGLPCPVIMMSGHGTVETAVEATRLGAYDFLEKPLSLAKLLLTAEHALEAEKLHKENIGLKKKADHILEPVGHSVSIQHLREQVKRLAQHDTWVLITGEPGTGRETFARFMHAQSRRHARPFVDVSVSSIAAGNSARELFGSEADGRVVYGRLEQASGGTLFLDEVADMDVEAQALLLGALDTGSFIRIGGSEPVDVDVRIIAATHKNLEEQVSQGAFLEDLFFHLNVVPLHIPPLREHREDVPELLSFYTEFFVEKEKLPYRRFSMAAQNYLRNYEWPGNIRELKNVVQRMMILSASEEISQNDVENSVANKAESEMQLGGTVVSFDQPIRQAREAFEKAYLEYQLEKHEGNVSQMAEEVGMERTHLYRKLRSVGIEIKDRR